MVETSEQAQSVIIDPLHTIEREKLDKIVTLTERTNGVLSTVADEMKRLRELRHADANTSNATVLTNKTLELEIGHVKEVLTDIKDELKNVSILLTGGSKPQEGFIYQVLEFKSWIKSAQWYQKAILGSFITGCIGFGFYLLKNHLK